MLDDDLQVQLQVLGLRGASRLMDTSRVDGVKDAEIAPVESRSRDPRP